jgi:hypothetical protein
MWRIAQSASNQLVCGKIKIRTAFVSQEVVLTNGSLTANHTAGSAVTKPLKGQHALATHALLTAVCTQLAPR